MTGFLLHQGATVLCMHAGQAQPVMPNPRVTVSGQMAVTMDCQYLVAGCTFPAISSGAPPCVSAQWITAATRVRAGGVPVVLLDSQSVCTPTGTPLSILVTQLRVKGT
jgi:hypothetical protein